MTQPLGPGEMVAPAAFAYFPGINQVKSLRFTLGHGITPSSGILECAPQPAFSNLTGNLMITYPGTPNIVLQNCLIDTSKVSRSPDGMIIAFHLLDRRWAWRNPTISGSYNVRMEDGTLDPVLQQTPQQLATLCLMAMGETNFDVSQLPNSTYPEVVWDNEIAARALQELCEQLGCRIVLTIAGSAVSIVVEGSGNAAPPGGLLQQNISISPPLTPDYIAVACGPSRFQVDLPLQPVGLDMDGTIKPIDLLSYMPKGGWQNSAPDFFNGVSPFPDPNGNIPLDYARQSVYKWYQVQLTWPNGFLGQVGQVLSGPTSYPVSIPAYQGAPLSNLRQILPIDDHQVQTFVDLSAVMQGQQQQTQNGQSTGLIRSVEAWVYGQFYWGLLDLSNTLENTLTGVGSNQAIQTPYPTIKQPFSIDREHAVVQFNDYQFQFAIDGSNNQTIQPANLVLRTAVNVRNAGTWDLARYVYTVPFNPTPIGTGTLVLHHDEIIYQSIPTYTLDQNGNLKLQSVADNSAAVQQECAYYVAAAAAQYNTTAASEYLYAGILNIELDGLKQQITWTLGNGQGATTSLSLNSEFSHEVIPYRLRRVYEDLRGRLIRRMKQVVSKMALSGDWRKYAPWYKGGG